MEIFYRYDLNGNGYLSRDEFNEFQMRSSGEACDNEAWDVLKGKIKKKTFKEKNIKCISILSNITKNDLSNET